MANELYRKVGGRYKPVGFEFVGWPANGVWYVHDGSRRLIMRIGDLPDPMPLAAMEQHRDAAIKALCDFMDHNPKSSLNDIVTEVFKAIAREQTKHLAMVD